MKIRAQVAELVTLAGVPIAETGIEYPVSTGFVTLTEDDLRDMVESQNDPAIVAPRLKLGHTDLRFAIGDGEPAFGTAQNLRLANSGNTVLCDYVGVPKWLADILPSAYPNRSIEGNFDVETVTGKKWRFVCTDVALLGVIWPGISTLADLEAAYSDEGPEGVEVMKLAAAQGAAEVSAEQRAQVLAQTNLEDVRRAFLEDVATEESGRYWWWVRQVLLDPNELIVDDDDGGLFRMSFEVSGEEVTFGDPVPVKVQYVDQVAARSAKQILAAVFDQPQERQEDDMGRRASGVAATIDPALLRRRLNLPEDATDEQVNEALAAQEEEAPQDEPKPGDQPESGDESSDEESSDKQQTEEPVTQASAGMVQVDSETLATLQRNSALGVQAFERQRVSDRDTAIQAAVQTGKIPPSRVEHWLKAWEQEFKATGSSDGVKAALDGMPEDLIPLGQRGVTPNEEAAKAGPAYPASWLPELNRNGQSKVASEA